MAQFNTSLNSQFNTPVAVHYWNAVTEGVSRFYAFVDIKTEVHTSIPPWAKTLKALQNQLPATPDLTYAQTAKNTWDTLVKVKSELDEFLETSDVETTVENIDKVNKFIEACKTRAKAFRIYRTAFTAFLTDSQCPLRTHLQSQFPGTATRICTELGALETKHLTFPEVSAYIDKPTSLKFLDTDPKPGQRHNKWLLSDVVQKLKPPLPAPPPKLQPPADPPRRRLEVVFTPASKAKLDCMRASLLSL
jgi:hypothetical protein